MTPGFELLLYITFAPDTNQYARYVAGIAFTALYSIVFLITYVCTWVTTSANKARPILIAGLKQTSLSTHQRWKVMEFIERLSARDIGFYCYDMFAMNNYEFMTYLLGFLVNHFLTLNLVIICD